MKRTNTKMDKKTANAIVGQILKAHGLETPTHPQRGDEVIWTPTGIRWRATGGSRGCTVGCWGGRVGIRWDDGRITWPCPGGMTMVKDGDVWNLTPLR